MASVFSRMTQAPHAPIFRWENQPTTTANVGTFGTNFVDSAITGFAESIDTSAGNQFKLTCSSVSSSRVFGGKVTSNIVNLGISDYRVRGIFKLLGTFATGINSWGILGRAVTTSTAITHGYVLEVLDASGTQPLIEFDRLGSFSQFYAPGAGSLASTIPGGSIIAGSYVILDMVCRGNEISVYINEQFVYAVNDSNYTSGECGFYIAPLSGATMPQPLIKCFEVWPLSPYDSCLFQK